MTVEIASALQLSIELEAKAGGSLKKTVKADGKKNCKMIGPHLYSINAEGCLEKTVAKM